MLDGLSAELSLGGQAVTAATSHLSSSTPLALAHERSSLRVGIVEGPCDELSERWLSGGRLDRSTRATVGIVPDHRLELRRKLTLTPRQFELGLIVLVGDEPLTEGSHLTSRLIGHSLRSTWPTSAKSSDVRCQRLPHDFFFGGFSNNAKCQSEMSRRIQEHRRANGFTAAAVTIRASGVPDSLVGFQAEAEARVGVGVGV